MILRSVNNSTSPLAARNLHGSTDSQANTRVAEQSTVGTAVEAQVEVEVGAVLVGACETVLAAQRVS